MLDGWGGGGEGGGRLMGAYEWKSATVALSPGGSWMNSWPAPLMTVRGTRESDTAVGEAC